MRRIALIIFITCSLKAQSQIITTWAGGGSGGDGTPAITAAISCPTTGCFDKRGNYYFVSACGHIVRMIDSLGIVHTVVGTGIIGFGGDGGLADTAKLHSPGGIRFDSMSNLYIADAGNNRIRKIDSATNIISTIAGNGIATWAGDNGPANLASINTPNDICFDKFGNIYISDPGNWRIRKITSSGVISNYVGTGVSGYSGDNGPANLAQIAGIRSIITDTIGNLYMADQSSTAPYIRKVNTSGIISTIAGSGSYLVYNGDNIAALSANISPVFITFDKHGFLFFSDTYHSLVRKIDATGIVHTVAGNGISGFSGDNGQALSAELNHPSGIAFDSCNNLYISEINGGRIRKVWIGTTTIPSASITVTPNDTVCAGATVTFTVIPTNAGTAPTYQWLKNNAVITGATNATYSYIPNDGDSVQCIVVSSVPCAGPTLSNAIYLTTTSPTTPATISITATPSGAVCTGTSVSYTATITNGGTTPSYQWIKNGANIGTNSSTYTYTPNNNDSIRCVLTSSVACTTPVSSNTVNMTVNPTVVPNVSITANPSSTVCTGTSVTFTATPTNGGTTPSYQWQKNGLNVGTNSTTYTYVPANGDQIKCVLSSNATCANPTTAISNIITMTVSSSIVPAVSITVSPNDTVCAGTQVTYTATQTGGGSTPAYQWIMNGANAGTNSNTYTYTPNNNDSIRCVLTSNAACASPTTAGSNSIHMTVQPTVIPTIAISISPNDTVCTGTSVTLTATATNGGAIPSYQWLKNGANAGSNNTTYNYTPNNNDSIRCVLTSNADCASPTTANSNSINITVDTLIVPTISITAPVGAATGNPVTATATVTNAGSSYTIYWMNHGVVFATTNVPPATGNSTTYTKGAGTDSLTAKVVVTGGGCYDSTTTPTVTTVTSTTGISHIANNSNVQVYPNPTNDLLHVDNITQTTSYQLQNIVGQSVLQGIFTQQNNTIQLQALSAGIYLLHLTDATGQKEVVRVVKE